uniref:AlNc14C344G10830 protein n=1 Tax=Albugo laibachii Nc14 TaxID=890382 RepID=F0WX72_9STRA|nr:AlNc14C344G10830 [Albugo laibachii Nc14]|eukprot:CCA26063.1 AlNc14C344G10830 [Albugo laibachii Nc14]
MKTYVAITTFLQCCVYFVKDNMAISYLVNDMSIEVVVISCSVLEYVRRIRDAVMISYSGAELCEYFSDLRMRRNAHKKSSHASYGSSRSPFRTRSDPNELSQMMLKLNSVQSTYSYEAEKRVYGINTRVLRAIWSLTEVPCPVLLFMSTGANDFRDDTNRDKAQVLAMKALWRMMEQQMWSTDVAALSATDSTRMLFVTQDREIL